MRNTSTANAVVYRSVGVLAIDSMTATQGARMLLVKSKVRDGACLMVSLEDTGTGINPEDIQRIFNPLFTTKSNGMGMGLSICRSIIEAHGGKLWVEPNTGGGATFHFTLTTEPSPPPSAA
jgi:signal transduction histidine kinase